jgi:hypothetical protein
MSERGDSGDFRTIYVLVLGTLAVFVAVFSLISAVYR